MTPRPLYLVAYDIRCPKRLRRALKLARAHAYGGQKSVFECFLTAAERRGLLAAFRRLLASEDSFLLLRLDPRATVRTLGRGVAPNDSPYLYIG